MSISTPLLIALLLTAGWLCQWLAWRSHQPAIVYLLLTGIVLGPVTGWLNPDQLFGELLFHFVSLGVAIILFEGSLTLRLDEARGVSRIIRNLVTLGVLITMAVMALAAHYIGGLSWQIALLFGAMMAVTGPTVIVPMLRAMQPTARIGSILRWEGILVDPIGALLAVLVYEAIVSGQSAHSLEVFFQILAAGVGLGLLAAVIVGELLKRGWVPDYLQNFFILSLVLLSFSAANVIADESGLLAVTVFGILLANQKHLLLDSIIDFKEHLSVLIISMLFILLASRMDLNLMLALWPACVGILLTAQFIARPLSVLLCGIGTSINFREGLLLAWVAPRGIVAAAVSALFAMRLHQAGSEEALVLMPLSFAVILGTVLIQGGSSRFIAKWLGLSAADRQGVFIVGVDNVSLAVAEVLQKQDIPVLLADERWDAANEARMAGFDAWYGNVLSERAEYHLDLVGMQHLLVVAKSPQQSALVATHYRPEFGASNTFTITQEPHAEQKRMTRSLRARPVASTELSWSKFASLLAQGWKIKATRLSEAFSLEQYRAKWPNAARPLFALTPQGKLRVFTEETRIEPEADWTVIALLNPEAEVETAGAGENEDQGIKGEAEPASGIS